MSLLPATLNHKPALYSRPKRPRARPVRTSEQALHRQVATFLAYALAGSSWFSTIPLGGGGKLRGAILSGLGTKQGIPDILVVNDGRAIWLELKTYTGVVAEAQTRCHAELRRARCPVYVVRSLDEAIAVLTEAGVPLRVSAA